MEDRKRGEEIRAGSELECRGEGTEIRRSEKVKK
jgi:hypothetical protein